MHSVCGLGETERACLHDVDGTGSRVGSAVSFVGIYICRTYAQWERPGTCGVGLWLALRCFERGDHMTVMDDPTAHPESWQCCCQHQRCFCQLVCWLF